jgi:hypothetical protein
MMKLIVFFCNFVKAPGNLTGGKTQNSGGIIRNEDWQLNAKMLCEFMRLLIKGSALIANTGTIFLL